MVIDGNTLTKGGTINVDKTQLSFEKGGTGVVIGTSTQQLAYPGITVAANPVLNLGGSTYIADSSSDFIIKDQTLTKGGTVVVDGTTVSYDEADVAVVIGTSTQRLSFADITPAAEPILTFDGSTYTADPSSDFVIDGQTLTRGGAITMNGTPLFYDQAGTDVIIGTSTQLLRTTNVATALDPTITFDGSTYYADASSDFVIDDQALTKGGVITMNGTPISYAAAGTDVVVGTSTEAVEGLGGYIMSGFGGGGSGPSGIDVQPAQFTGRTGRMVEVSWGSWGFVLGAMVVCFSLG